jgi:cytochrome c-type biogenesis protein
MGSLNISLGLAFIAGLASFLSPCVFPLVPAYVSYLSGRSSTAADPEADQDKLRVFTHGLAFVIGFSLVFILLGLATSALGGLLQDLREWLAKIGGIVVVIFGIHMTGLWRIPFLQYDTRKQSQPDGEGGYLASVLMGVFFSAGWSPCVGPVLGAILTLSLSGGSIWTGGLLLTAYSAGLAVPFLIAALGLGWVTTTLRKYGKVMHYAEIFMGVILIIVGIMLFLGTFERLAALGSFISINL